LQYLAPTLQFLIGVLIDGEPMPLSRLAGFALVWTALAISTYDAVRRARATRAGTGWPATQPVPSRT
jgi:chloramphenicol-sensitive protein RarD